MIKDFLRKIPLFAQMSEDDLEVLSNSVEVLEISAGEMLFTEGDEGDRAYVIKDGEVEILKNSGGREVLLAVRGSGIVIGEIALLESLRRTASVRARTDVVLYVIGKEDFENFLKSSPSALHSMFNTILSRYHENQSQLRQGEKMAQLGTLTAGVAHELNNPAAAVQRGADQLQKAINDLNGTYARIAELGFSDSQLATLNRLAQLVQEKAKSPPEMDALVRSDREYAIETWLEGHGIENPWDVAPTMVNLDFNEEELGTLAEDFAAEKLVCIVNWLNATFNVFSLLKEIGEGAGRMSKIVKSLKSYSYLDQAPMQEINIHEGLDDTLVILQNKLKKNKVNVKREYALDLPLINAYGSELNQVWTNLIDNAADALEGRENSELIIRTRPDGLNWVIIEFEDNGPGIPEEIRDKIFDAFFTTKPPGKGSGLGLDISYKTIVQKHRGDLQVQSKPGQTIFLVRLPVNFEDQ